MANITKIPDALADVWNGNTPSWSYGLVYDQQMWVSTTARTVRGPAYLVELSTEAIVSACSLEVEIQYYNKAAATYRCEVYTRSGTRVSVQQYTAPDGTASVTHKFSFSGLSISGNSFYFLITMPTDTGDNLITHPTATVTYSYPTLTVSPSPATVYDMSSSISPSYINTVTLTFGNRIGQTLHVQFKYNSTVVWDFTNIDEDSYSKGMYDFFADAGATGSSITVRVDVSDELGRTANASFTLIKPQGSTATPSAPKNTTLDGTLPINFAWSVSDTWGDQTMAELQYSTDNAAWINLATINGSTKSWAAPNLKFPGGTIYWRARVTNDFGIVGAWSSSVSFTVRYDAVSQVYPVNSQTSGNFSRTADKTFQVGLETTGQVPTPFTIASAVFHWRAGTSGTWTDVNMTRADGNLTASVTIPANTFPTGQMQWYAEATDNTGRTTETAIYTLTALTAAVVATPLSPINTVEAASSEIYFYWTVASADGSAQNATKFKIYPPVGDAEEYTLYGDYDSANVAANHFTAGTVQWQVQARNTAGVWSEWSELVSFRVMGAPTVEGITGDGKPFLTITWQTPTDSDYGQQAYKIEVDEKLYGPYFGANVRSYTLKEPLEDGPHRVRIAAQNRFGLWSEWAESNVVVTNVPGPAFSFLAGAQDPAAFVVMVNAMIAPTITRQPQDYQRGTDGLAQFMFSVKTTGKYGQVRTGIMPHWEYRTGPSAAWQEYTGQAVAYTALPTANASTNGYQYRVKAQNLVGEIYSDPGTFYYREPSGFCSDLQEGEWPAPTGYFLIYRDGELVGKTYENGFIDMAAVGTVSYDVIQVLPDGYYTRGTAIVESVEVPVSAPTLIPLGTTNYLTLRLSEDPRRVQDIRREAEVAYTQYEGATFPEAEIGEHETLSVSGDCAWTWEEREKAETFRSYLKKPVIYKTPGGERVVGVLTGYTKKDAHFYRTARFSIQQMDWRDFVDES